MNKVVWDTALESFQILGEIDFSENPFGYVFYPERPISRPNRQRLKALGWRLGKHTRNKKDIWVWDKQNGNLLSWELTESGCGED